MEFNKQERYAVRIKCDVSHFIGEILVIGLRQIIQTIILLSKFRSVFREATNLNQVSEVKNRTNGSENTLFLVWKHNMRNRFIYYLRRKYEPCKRRILV